MSNGEKREYLRLAIPGLIVKYNVFDEKEQALWLPKRRQIYTLAPEDAEDLEPVFQSILDKLERLETKMDLLLQWMGRGFERKIFAYQDVVADISGGGLSICTTVNLVSGKIMELCIMSRVGEMSPIFAIGRVCWVEERNDVPGVSKYVGVEFEDIYEEDRQAIIKMVFDAERRYKKERSVGRQ